MAPQTRCDIVQGTGYSGSEPAVMVLGLVVEPTLDGSLRIEASVTCRAYWLPQSNFVQTSVCIACTGVDVLLSATGATLNANASGYPPLEARHSVIQRAESGRALELPLAAPPLQGKASSQAMLERSVQFSERTQQPLSMKQLSPHMVEWSFEMGRGLGTVRDYLNETLKLESLCRPTGKDAEIRCTAKPRSLGFFGSDNRRLGTLQSTALYIKLCALGVALPAGSPVSLAWRGRDMAIAAPGPEVP